MKFETQLEQFQNLVFFVGEKDLNTPMKTMRHAADLDPLIERCFDLKL